MTLSVVVLTRNVENHIKECLVSVREFADELLVLDDNSSDRTVEIACELGARIEYRTLDNFPNQRNMAMEMAQGEWVFFIDSDERATPALGQEIYEKIKDEERRGDSRRSAIVGFWVPRRNIIFGREIRYTGWSPDYQPRVMRKGSARFDPARQVHELVLWDGEVGYLRQPLIHYNYDTLAQFRAKQIVYTRYEAQVWHAEGKRARLRGFIGQPLREFFRRYISLQGWRDGKYGLLLSVLMAYYALARQKLLWDLGKKRQVIPKKR